jgi:hypothetical protein
VLAGYFAGVYRRPQFANAMFPLALLIVRKRANEGVYLGRHFLGRHFGNYDLRVVTRGQFPYGSIEVDVDNETSCAVNDNSILGVVCEFWLHWRHPLRPHSGQAKGLDSSTSMLEAKKNLLDFFCYLLRISNRGPH